MSIIIKNYDVYCDRCGKYIYSGIYIKFLTEEDIILFRKESYCTKCREEKGE